MIHSLALRLCALSVLPILAGCLWPQPAAAPKPLSQRLTWCGRQAGLILDSVPSDTGNPSACIRIQRLEFPGATTPFRMELRQYRDPVRAFVAWEGLALQTRPQEGCVRIGSRWAFIHAAYVGLTDSSAGELYPEEFRERLAAADEPAILFPEQFKAFPLLGRIPGSERISMKDFLGGPWSGPVFSVGYPCHGDTAIAFRASARDAASLAGWMNPWKFSAPGRAADFTLEKRYQGEDEFGRPMILRAFSDGILGISGCYDSDLGQEYAEKMRKMQVFWHDP
ncbi:MAG: hypothetical protein JF616_10475 [Fibrobacteres bacterium]|jgi:hypothetical protein|nr:hypothetical protein [Fibrobacterota bacterium]